MGGSIVTWQQGRLKSKLSRFAIQILGVSEPLFVKTFTYVHLVSLCFTMFYYVSLCFRFTWAKQRLSPILPPVAPSFGPLDGTMEVHLADALPLAVPRSATERSGDWVDDMAMGLLAVCHHYRTLPV